MSVVTPSKKKFNSRIFHIDNKYWVENMHILANMKYRIWIKGRLIFSSKFLPFLCDKEVKGSCGMMTECDMRGRGSKISMFHVTYFLNSPSIMTSLDPLKAAIHSSCLTHMFLFSVFSPDLGPNAKIYLERS